jgi:hypothetical protein
LNEDALAAGPAAISFLLGDPWGADPGRDGTLALHIGSSWTVGPANPVGVIAELIWLVALMGRYPLWHSTSADLSKLGSPARRHETHPDRPN